MTPTPRRIAVVGSGVAGLTAAYVASRTAHVTLFEADDRLGGHADTHLVQEGERELAIDTGFIVHNPRTYPVLLRLFAELGVATQGSEMSMSIRDDGSGLEWAGALGRKGVFPTAAHLRRPRYLRMLTEIPRFHRRARAVLAETGPDTTLRELPRRRRVHGVLRPALHGAAGRRGVVVRPRGRAGLSGALPVHLPRPPRDARRLRQPAVAHGHRRLAGSTSPRSAPGSRRSAPAPRSPRSSRPPDGVEVTDGNGSRRRLRRGRDRHPPQPGAEPAGRADRRPARGARGDAVLAQHRAAAHRHLGAARRDQRLGVLELPAPRSTEPATEGTGQVLVTYDLTRLQRLDTETHYLVTLGGEDLVDPATGHRPDGVRAPPLQPPVGRRAGAAAGHRHRAASASPAPTTAGASTRTAPARGCAPSSGSG